jgi:hypothetical protein
LAVDWVAELLHDTPFSCTRGVACRTPRVARLELTTMAEQRKVDAARRLLCRKTGAAQCPMREAANVAEADEG